MASNPPIKAVPFTTADPHSRIQRFVQAQCAFAEEQASEGKLIWDEYKRVYELEAVERKKARARERRAITKATSDQRDASGEKPSMRTETSGTPGRSRGSGNVFGVKRPGGVKNKMRDRFGNLPGEANEPSPCLRKDISDGKQDVGLDREHLILPNARTPELLTRKQMEARIRLEDKRESGSPGRTLGKPGMDPNFTEFGEKTGRTGGQGRGQSREESNERTRKDGTSGEKAQSEGKKRVLGETVSKQAPGRSIEIDALVGLGQAAKSSGKRRRGKDKEEDAERGNDKQENGRGKKPKLNKDKETAQHEGHGKEKKRKSKKVIEQEEVDSEHDARLEARKLKRRVKASILHAKPLVPASPPSKSNIRTTKPKKDVKWTSRGVVGKQSDSESEEDDERSVIVVQNTPPQRKVKSVNKAAAMVRADLKSDKRGRFSGVTSKSEKPKKKSNYGLSADKDVVRGAGAGSRAGRHVSVLAKLSAEGAERINGRLTLKPTRGIFGKGFASANLPVLQKSKKVLPVSDLAPFCESTFMSRRKPEAIAVRKRKLPPPETESSSSSEAGEGVDEEETNGSLSGVDSSELSSAPPTNEDVKKAKARVKRAAKPSLTSEASSPRYKTRQPGKVTKAKVAPRVEKSKGAHHLDGGSTDSTEGSPEPQRKRPNPSHGLASADWPSSLPDEEDVDEKSSSLSSCARQSVVKAGFEEAVAPRVRASKRADKSDAIEVAALMGKPEKVLPGLPSRISRSRAQRASASQYGPVISYAQEGEEDIMNIIRDAIVPTVRRGRRRPRQIPEIVQQDVMTTVECQIEQDWMGGSHGRQILGHRIGREGGSHQQGRYQAWHRVERQVSADLMGADSEKPQALIADLEDEYSPSRDDAMQDEAMTGTPGHFTEQEWVDSQGGGSARMSDDHVGICEQQLGMEWEAEHGMTDNQEEPAVLDMFGTTEIEARRLWRVGRPIR